MESNRVKKLSCQNSFHETSSASTMQISQSQSHTFRSIRKYSFKTYNNGFIALIILLKVCMNCEGFTHRSFNPLSYQSVWEISITYSYVFAGGLLARTISGKSISVNNPVTIPSLSWKSPQVNLTSDYSNNGTTPRATSSISLTEAKPESNKFSDDVHRPPYPGPLRYRRVNRRSDKGKLRLQLLKQIKSLDHMKCFPKVLCGLSVDSSKSSSGIDPQVVKSYIQLMRSAKPAREDDSSEEGTPTRHNTKDALSLFLMKSGIIKPKKNSGENSGSTSTSDEDEYEDMYLESPDEDDSHNNPDEKSLEYKSAFERNREQLENIILSKRVLDTGDEGNKTHHHFKDDNFNPSDYRPVLYMNPSSMQKGQSSGSGGKDSSSPSKVGSLVSSWVPWLSFSLGTDSFEKDPFFTPGSKITNKVEANKKDEAWQKDFDRLAYVMRLKQAVDRQRKKNKTDAKKKGRSILISQDDRQARDFKEDEMAIYATAVEIGQKLKDTRQCDYLYNGCPIPYSDIIKIISSIRKEIKQEEETVDLLSQEMFGTERPTTPVQRRKQTMNKQTKKPIRRQQLVSKPKPNPVRQPVQAPMTKISHTLPNGEKVEINVQVSGKHDLPVSINTNNANNQEEEYEDEAVPAGVEDLFEEEDSDDGFNFQEDAKVFEVPAVEEEEEPAISASYELDDEIQDDFRKPTPLDIFNKISLKATDELTTTTVATTTTAPTTTTTRYTVSKKPKAKPSTTRKPATKRPSTKQPGTTRRPASSRRPATSRRPAPKPVKMPTVKPRVKQVSTVQSQTKKSKRPNTSTTIKTTTKRPVPTTVKTRRPSTSTKITTKIPSRRKKPSIPPQEFEPSTSSTTKASIKTSTTESPVDAYDEEFEDKEVIVFTPSSTVRPKPSKKPTEPALAMFTTTTNFMLDFIVKDLSTTERFTKPSFSSLAPVINRYSVMKKSKPAESAINSPVDSIKVETVPETPFFSSMQYDSSEVSILNPEEGTETFIITRDEPQTVINTRTTTTTTTAEPKLFESKRKTNTQGMRVNSENNKGTTTGANKGTTGGKRIIKYKNAKLPHLVLMTAPTLSHPNPTGQLSESSITITGNRRRPKPSPKPQYSLSAKKPSSKPSSSIENPPPPLVFEPGKGSGEYIPWSPHQ